MSFNLEVNSKSFEHLAVATIGVTSSISGGCKPEENLVVNIRAFLYLPFSDFPLEWFLNFSSCDLLILLIMFTALLCTLSNTLPATVYADHEGEQYCKWDLT